MLQVDSESDSGTTQDLNDDELCVLNEDDTIAAPIVPFDWYSYSYSYIFFLSWEWLDFCGCTIFFGGT